MSAPKRIWLDWPDANRGDAVYDEPPERDTQPGQTEYIRKDASDAAIAAARAEGVREGMLKAAGISDEKAEHLRKCNFKPGGFGPFGGWVGVASDVADRIRAAAEAQP